jgi:hypothetical protein
VPNSAELARLKKLFDQAASRYRKDPTLMQKVGADPESAAKTLVANVLLNMDETISKN